MTTADVDLVPHDREWQRQARCRLQYSAYFFPPGDGESREDRAAREASARSVCHTCPVQRACLDLALELEEPQGIWGGMNGQERRRLRRRRALGRA